jgi:hypothetical protein
VEPLNYLLSFSKPMKCVTSIRRLGLGYKTFYSP